MMAPTMNTLVLGLLAANGAMAFPWVAMQPGVDSSILGRRGSPALAPRASTCPYNANHTPAPLVTSKYPYNNAKNGLPGNGKGGYLVPAKGDTVHAFKAPGPNDIRGPCPGLNAAANHGFLARDGITTYDELVDAQQNVYNVGYDLANVLATAGVGLDGDLIGTGKLSIGCDATSRTAGPLGAALGDELGLDGHNKFESDTSLTRNDYFLANGDDYTWNATLFEMMLEVCNGNCNREALSKYRLMRWQQSEAENGNFFFSPGALLLYGAASFLYELMPTNGGIADPATMMSFFGAKKSGTGYAWNGGERIPPNWYVRDTPYDNNAVTIEIAAMYLENPVMFGGNIGRNNFNGMNFSTYIENGQLRSDATNQFMCLIYQDLTAGIPSELGEIIELPVALYNKMVSNLSGVAKNFGCPLDQNDGSSA